MTQSSLKQKCGLACDTRQRSGRTEFIPFSLNNGMNSVLRLAQGQLGYCPTRASEGSFSCVPAGTLNCGSCCWLS